MGVYITYTPRLPSEYQEVEYIQSSGTQYIDTGFKFTQTTGGIETKFRPTNLSGAWSDYRVCGSYVDNGRAFILYCGSTAPRLGVGSVTQELGTIAVNNDYTLKATVSTAGTCKYTFNGTSSSFTYSGTIVNNYNIALFGNNDLGTVGQKWSGRIYYMKIYNSGILVRNFIPCYRKSDNVIGLYDLVNNQFYTNSGTGTFSKGNDVTMVEMKNAYIGEVYEYSYDFRNKSSTILTNDGWTFPDGTTSLGFDSNGMYNSSTSRRWAVRSIDLSNAKKITYTANTIQVSTKNVGMRLASDNTGSTSNSIGFAAIDSTIYRVLFGDNTASANPTGNIQGKIIADLENKSLVMYDGSYSKSFTLTDANVTKIRGLNYLLVCAFKSGNYIQDIKLLVEE